jgi:hypothetical protein
MAGDGVAAPAKGAAARAEVNGNGKPKQITWNGTKFDLPGDLPGTVLWDFAALEEGEKQLAPLMALLNSVLGDDQARAVKALVAEKGWNIEKTTEALMDDDKGLIPKITAKYGLTTGESEASQES